MPEGPEIRIAADRIERALAGRTARSVRFAFPHLQPFESALEEEEVVRVETRGKAMLTIFANGLVVYSHNQLYGRWHVGATGVRPATRRTLRLAIENDEHAALLYSASEIEVLEWAQVGEHPYVRALGPDPLDAALEEGAVASRLTDARFAGRALASLLLDQRFLAGVGNYLRAEICFAAGVHPSRRPRDLDSGARERIAAAALAMCRRSYTTRGITNDPERAARLRRNGILRSRYRFQVFARSGEPCWHCDATIERAAIGGRRCYWCPECQPGPAARGLEPTA
jgi:endonuclease-8